MKKIYSLLSLALVIMTACEDYTDPTLAAPTVTTGAAENIYRMGATLSGSYTDGSSKVPSVECGIMVSEMQSMPEPRYYEVPSPASGVPYSIELRNLTPGKTYYYQSYAGSGVSVVKGEVHSFTTTYSNPPIFETLKVVKQTPTSCEVSASLIDDGGSEMLMTGFFWKEDDGNGIEPTFIDPSVNAVYTSGSFQAAFKNLRPGHTYLIRPYGVNKEGIGLGKTLTVTMEQGGVPSLTAPEPSATTRYSALLSSHVYDTGTSAYSKVGFCWSKTNPYPTIEDAHQMVDLPAKSDGDFTFPFEADEQLTTYYICAFAENEEGVGYSEPFEFTTGRFIELNSYTANDESVTVYGQVYRQSGHFQLIYAENESALDNPSNPDVIWSSMQPNMDADGKFSETRKDLKPSTTYYVRALMGSENPMQSNTLRIQTGEKPQGEPTPTIMPATSEETGIASPVIQQLINNACQNLVIDTKIHEGSVTYTLTYVFSQEMDYGQALVFKVPFEGFASTITPDYTTTESATSGQQWLAKAEEMLGLTYGMKNIPIEVTPPINTRITGCRLTMEFIVKTMEYDHIKGQLIYANLLQEDIFKNLEITFEEKKAEDSDSIDNGDGSIDDAPVEDLL